MAEGPNGNRPAFGRGAPLGRGQSLLDMLKRSAPKVEEPSPMPVTLPAKEVQAPTLAPPVFGFGRGSMLKAFELTSVSSPPTPQTTGASRSRGSLLNLSTAHTPGSLPHVAPEPAFGEGSGDHARLLGSAISKLSVKESSIDSKPVTRQGESGKTRPLKANHITLKLQPGRGVFEYEVKFSPDLDSRPLRLKLLNQHTTALGGTKTFDGTLLYLSSALTSERTEFTSEHPADGSPVILTVIFKKQRRFGEVPHLYNILFRRILNALKLVQIGRQHFNSRAAHPVPQHKLELWPGYVTAVDEHEGGLQLCLDSTHRVLRTETVRDLIYEVSRRQARGGGFQDAVVRELIGTSVLTRYNNKVYRIDDISWNETPLKEFSLKSDPDNKITLVQYYKNHWGIEIKDKEQPLLIHRSKIRLTTGEEVEQVINLIPELCYMSGLTDAMRQDFTVMKDLGQVTRTSPEHRAQVIHSFIQEVKQNQDACNLLAGWGLSIDDTVIPLNGRVLDPETILFGNNQKVQGLANADWNGPACRLPMRTTPNLKNWYIVFAPNNAKAANDFSDMIIKVSPAMGMEIYKPKMARLNDDRTESFLRELRKIICPQVELVVVIFPTIRNDRYSAIKKLCCVEIPIASQVIIAKTISRPDKLKSVTQKITLQINCKLGGTLWALNTPPWEKCMVCGVDTYHAGPGTNKHGSVAGFVASLDKQYTQWYSKVCLLRPQQELIDSLKICLMFALKAYAQVNHGYPTRIIMYRDGVGDGQINTVRQFEVQQLEQTFSMIEPDYRPSLSVVLVQKRINTRIFAENRNRLENPPPGTIVDHTITRRNLYDFFLVSQNVRQGTVTPTHYIVIYDSGDIKTDHMQRLTFKLCHLYYNWPGTVRVPAPCQYAHKLATLVGESIQMEPSDMLANKLYFL